MPQSCRVLTTTLVLCAAFAVEGRGRQLLELDGVELRGAAQLVLSGGGTCNVLESDSSYEARKENHGAPMDIWRLDFSVHNGSGRWLDHLIARFQIDSVWPECTNWDVPQARRFAEPIEWAGSNGHIQKSGRNVVAPGRTLTQTNFFLVLRGDPQPRFANWSMDFDFATAPPPPGFGSGSAPQQTLPVVSPEQENIFWQSIVDSTNPAMFEAYLAQFPNGVFRALAEVRLAEVRLAELRAPGSDLPAANRLPAEAGSQADRELRQPERRTVVPQPLCDFDHEIDARKGMNCWYKLTSPPDCYAWVGNNSWPGADPEWTGQCIDGVASGSGTLITNGWYDRKCQSTGSFRAGKKLGRWLDLRVDGLREEGPMSKASVRAAGFPMASTKAIPSLVSSRFTGTAGESTTGIPNWSNPAGGTPEERENRTPELKEFLIAGAAPIPSTLRNPPPQESCKRPRVMPVTSI